MSRKKSRYKAKYKGVRYIAKALTKYQKGKYPSYNKALPDARKYLAELKKNNEKVVLKNLWKYSRKRKVAKGTGGKKGKAPILDPNLTRPSFYFDLIDYPTWILRCPNNVWFVSDLIPSNLDDIQGGTSPDYDLYFAPYVNFINGAKGLTNPEDNRYETDWLVVCTEPTFNNANKRWESKIISVDSNGNEFNYGFDPKTPTKLAEKAKLSGAEKPTEQPTKEKPTEQPKQPTQQPTEKASAERVKEIRGLIADLREDAKAGLITKEDYRASVRDLISKLDKGGSV